MSESLQALIGDILRALEDKGIYRAGPPGLSCSICTVQTIADYETISFITVEHVITDETMLSLLQELSAEEWERYLSGRFTLTLTDKCSVEVDIASLHNPVEEGHRVLTSRRYHGFFPSGQAAGLQCWGLWWQISGWQDR